jgi:hypothetical protein
MSNNQKVFTVYHILCEGTEPQPQFAFHAKDDTDALKKAYGWGRYHSFNYRDLSVKLATEHEKEHWLHDEYID